MNKTVKIIIAVLVALVISVGAVVGGIFGARAVEAQKRREAERRAVEEREQATASVEKNFLLGLNENWKTEMTSQEISALYDAGDYVVAKGWTELVVGVLYDSPLQTAKIRALANAINSEQGKKLFEDFDEHVALLIPLLRSVGFTSSDISSLVYSLALALVNDGANTLVDMRDALASIKSERAAKNVQKNIAAVNAELTYLNFTAEERASINNALSDAEGAIKELAVFAYTTSINTLTNEMVEMISNEDGALSDVTDGEIQTVVSAMMANVKSLKAYMTADKIEKLNVAIQTLTLKLDGNITTSRIFAQIVSYAKMAYFVTDSIPYFCSLVESIEGAITLDFLSVLRTYVEHSAEYSENVAIANASILAAKITAEMYANIDTANLDGFVDTLAEQAKSDYKRTAPLVLLDLYLNITSIDEKTSEVMHPTIINADVFEDMLLYVIMSAGISNFERTYYNYLDGKATIDQVSAASPDFQKNLDIAPCSYTWEENPKERFEYYIRESAVKMNAKTNALADTLKADVLAFVEDYHQDNSALKNATEQLANCAPLPVNATEEQVNERLALVINARLYGMALLLQGAFK